MTIRAVIIGDVNQYQLQFNLLNNEIKSGNLSIVGFVLENSKFDVIDNIPVFNNIQDLIKINFDFFILLTENKDLYHEIPKLGFEQYIIPIRVFSIPHFNLLKYIDIVKNPPSIICRHCWGGLLFHRLGLKFQSPFINLFLSEKDFNKLSKDFHYYMNQELIFKEEAYEPVLKRYYPVVKLGDLIIHFNHYTSFEEAKSKWDERKNRINYDNLLFETTAEDFDTALEFSSLPIEHKICFCLDDIPSPGMINFTDLFFRHSKDISSLGMIVNGTATGLVPYFDLFGLLSDFDYTPRIKSCLSGNQRCFDLYKQSNFYRLEHDRFLGNDDKVNWALNDKIEAYKFVEKFNVSHPNILFKFDDIHELENLVKKGCLPNKFVLKILNKSSCIRVMILRKLKYNLFYEDIDSKYYSLEDIINQKFAIDSTKTSVLSDTYYFIEEYIDNYVNDFKIPWSYKVFCFNGVPKLILQISRNINQFAISLFDGNFIPLKEGRDWFVNPEMAKEGIPVIPPNAFKILSQSIEMAKYVDDSFVCIDWFDDGQKPIFEEFNFCSEATFRGMFALSLEILNNFDKSLFEEFYSDYNSKGYRIDSKKLIQNLDEELFYNDVIYKELIKDCSYGNIQGVAQMIRFFEDLSKNENNFIKKKSYQHLALCWQEILLLYDPSSTEHLCRQINGGYGFVFLKSEYYSVRINEAKDNLKSRGKISEWDNVRYAHFILEFGGSKEEINVSHNIVNEYAEKGLKYAQKLKDIYKI